MRRARIHLASLVLLAGRTAGGLSSERAGASARSRVPWPLTGIPTATNAAASVASTTTIPADSPLEKLAGFRLRGGWFGVEVVHEIAKAYLTPGGNPGADGGHNGEGGGRGAKGAGGERKGAGGRGSAARNGGLGGWTSPRLEEDGRPPPDSAGTSGQPRDDLRDGGGGGSPSNSGVGNANASGRKQGGNANQKNQRGSTIPGKGGSDSGKGRAVPGTISRMRNALQQQGSSIASPPAGSTGSAAREADGAARGRWMGGSSGVAGGRENARTGTRPAVGGATAAGTPGNGNHHHRLTSSSPPPPSAAAAAAASGSSSSPDGFPSHAGGVNNPAATGPSGNDHAVGSDGYTRGATNAAPSGATEPSSGWEDAAAGGWGEGGVEGHDDVGFVGGAGGGGGAGAAPGGMESGGSRGGEGDEEDEEAARAAAAAAAAARTRDEIALLREMEAMNVEQRARAEGLPPLGQHARSVVTEAMPQRFVDEVGAHIASALAIAVFKGLLHAIVNLRGQKKPEKVAFTDVVGCDEAKEEIKQIVDFLVDPSAYDSLGASRPKGILLVGPPGTGKTLIAKACAGEAGVPFLYACGSDFNGVYVGMGVAAVKRLFAKARKHKKSIIYIDEIDYLGRSRNSGARDASGATQDREATLNQLLSEMDGFEGKDGIVVMASTNRKEILDEALLRSGRFDMQVDVERPDRTGRQQLFSKYITPLKLSDAGGKDGDRAGSAASATSGGFLAGMTGRRAGRYFGGGAAAAALAAEKEKAAALRKEGLRDDIARELADMTPYMTGADVANVCATAGRIAARAGSGVVSLEHFSAAVDRVCHGLEKPGKEVPREEKERTAIHEAGHAVAGWMLPWCEKVVKVSIIWRGNALGFSQTAVTERLSDMRETVLDNVCMTLAGRAAEEVMCGTISGGASSDLRTASRQLYRAITEVGFGSATGLLAPGNRQLSEKVMGEVDQEVQKLLAEQYQRALDLIRQHRNAIDALSEALLEKGVVHKADLEDMLGEKVTVESAAAEAALKAATSAATSAADSSGTHVEMDGVQPAAPLAQDGASTERDTHASPAQA